ncbi:uncharacterized protein [Lolium perenne]|uniref:uncharacterized protein n=1 Tax=Lolium perenne TaxID=4522 RepID=UPI0021F58E79|nr:uncharacterized protein LOC127319697 [Lolium perenne]
MPPMKIISRLIPRLSPSGHRFASTGPPLHNASASPRWKPSEIAHQVPPSFPTASPPTRRVSRFPHRHRHMASSSRVKGEDLPKPLSAKDFIISLGMENLKDVDTTKVITRYTYVPPADSVEHKVKPSGDAILDKLSSVDKESLAAPEPDYVMEIFPNSGHRDGSIYSGTDDWKIDYRIADRNETWLEAMMFSDPTDCRMHNGICESHASRHMLQFLSLRLAKIPAELGSVELYGYIAARDNMNPLLNYIVHFSRDDPIIVKQGSLIHMAGPKRAIELVGTILIEYDMKIKAGEHEKEDLQVIDGISCLDNIDTWDRTPFTFRIQGDCGAIDVGVSRLSFAYEATVEVVVSQVQSSFSMCIGCFTSGLDEEIRLFDGAIGESRALKRSVVAVASDDEMELKLKVAADSGIPAEYCCCFQSKQHGRATQEIYTGFALIEVKVIWSTLNKPRKGKEAKAV